MIRKIGCLIGKILLGIVVTGMLAFDWLCINETAAWMRRGCNFEQASNWAVHIIGQDLEKIGGELKDRYFDDGVVEYPMVNKNINWEVMNKKGP